MPGLEGVATGIGAAVGSAGAAEGGGLGAAAIGTAVKAEVGLGAVNPGIANVEGLGAAIPKPEIGSIGNLSPEAGLAAKLDATLSTPGIGIKEVAEVKVPAPMGATESPLNKPPGVEVLEKASESATPPITGVENRTSPAAKPEDAALADKSKAVTEGEKPTDGKQIGEQKPPTETKDNQPASDKKDTKPPEDADKAKRTQELEGKVKDRTATADEIKELRGLKQDPEQRRKYLEQKAVDGAITDEEAEELGKLNSPENAENLTPEQQAEKLKKDIDDLGTELMTKMANGEEVTPEDLEKLRNLRGQESLINNGFTPDQAKSLGRVAERMRSKWSERQTQAAKEIQSEIQELMALELYLLSIPKTVEQLRAQAQALKDTAQAKHNEAEEAKGQDRLKKKGEEYTLYMQLLNAKSAIVAQKHMAPRIEARRQDLEQAVRRKLGVSHGFGALMEWGAAKTKNIITEVGVGIEEEADFKAGNN